MLAHLDPTGTRWDSCGTGLGSGLGLRLRNVGCLMCTHHLPQLLLCPFIFSSSLSLPNPSIPPSPGGWISLALISAAHTLEGEKQHRAIHAHPSHLQHHTSHAPDLLKVGVEESQQIPITRRGEVNLQAVLVATSVGFGDRVPSSL